MYKKSLGKEKFLIFLRMYYKYIKKDICIKSKEQNL